MTIGFVAQITLNGPKCFGLEVYSWVVFVKPLILRNLSGYWRNAFQELIFAVGLFEFLETSVGIHFTVESGIAPFFFSLGQKLLQAAKHHLAELRWLLDGIVYPGRQSSYA